MKPSVFIDSNIWFSAFYKEGLCSKLLEKIQTLGWKTHISELVLDEVVRNIQLKIPTTLSLFVDYLKVNKIIVLKNPTSSQLLPYNELAEKHDLPILASAIEFKCDYLLTGNLKDFNIQRVKKKAKITLISPKELWAELL